MSVQFNRIFSIIAPGILIAATGVGAGDLITASFAGNKLGLAVLWAPVLGGVLKLTLTEGLARFQIATQKTLLEGWLLYFGKWVEWSFLIYLVFWSYMVGGALINSCGAAMSAIFPLPFGDLHTSKVVWGFIHSALGVILALKGNLKFFEKLMSFLIGIMFFVVIVGCFFFIDSYQEVFSGFIPSIPKQDSKWLIGLVGGVGGTLTILSYGYWIKEQGRDDAKGLAICKIDLSVAYFLTAFFSVGMIILGSKLNLDGVDKAQIPLLLANLFMSKFGSWGYWLFLLGFWSGVFSSLLGVWQSVPYMFADFRRTQKKEALDNKNDQLSKSLDYKRFLFAIAIIPLSSLWLSFESIQLAYAIVGAAFIPCLALSLLVLNNSDRLARVYRNSWKSNLILVLTLVFFFYIGVTKFI